MTYHANAQTNIQQRKRIRQSREPYRRQAHQLGVSVATVAKWKRRRYPHDRTSRPRRIHTALPPEAAPLLSWLRKGLAVGPQRRVAGVTPERLPPAQPLGGLPGAGPAAVAPVPGVAASPAAPPWQVPGLSCRASTSTCSPALAVAAACACSRRSRTPRSSAKYSRTSGSRPSPLPQPIPVPSGSRR